MPLDRQDEASQEPLEKEVHQPDEVDKAKGRVRSAAAEFRRLFESVFPPEPSKDGKGEINVYGVNLIISSVISGTAALFCLTEVLGGNMEDCRRELERAMLLFGPYFTAVIPPFIANAVQKGRRLPAYVQGLFMQGLPYATLYTASKIAEILTH